MPKSFTQKQLIIILGGSLLVILLFTVILLNFRTKNTDSQTSLTIWGTDSSKVFNDVLAPYTNTGSSGAKITYVHVDPSEYQTKLLAALAAGTGPDIFEIGNRDLSQWESVIAPLPATMQQSFNLATLQNEFPTIVSQDFVAGSQIYGLPLSIDTMAMIYNKDLLDSAGIAFPPKTWQDFQADVPKLKSVNDQGQVTQAAAAIGGSTKSISSAPDMIFLLMLQNGTQMLNQDLTQVMFASGAGGDSSGLSAFNFYLQFANASSPNYTWNDSMGNSVDNFIQGKTAIIFDYPAALAEIKAKAPFLNVGVAPMPQPAGATVSINYAKYLGLAAARTGNISAAWNFILKLATSDSNDKNYVNDTGSSPALRSSIQNAMGDPAASVFAAQALTARSWYEKNSARIENIMNNAIQNVETGAADSGRALSEAQQAINQQ